MTYFDVHYTKQPLISKVRRLINYHYHTKVYTDEYLAYENLKKYGFVHRIKHRIGFEGFKYCIKNRYRVIIMIRNIQITVCDCVHK